FGTVITEASLQLDRYAIESQLIDMHLTAASLNLTSGFRFEVTEQVPIQVFAGVAPMLVMPTYDRIDDSVIAGNAYDFEEQGAHVVWTFPVGVVIQDVVRFGFRFVAGDDFDSTAGHTDAPDFITFVSLGYRFDLLRCGGPAEAAPHPPPSALRTMMLRRLLPLLLLLPCAAPDAAAQAALMFRGGPSVLTNASNPDVERGGVSGYGVVGARL